MINFSSRRAVRLIAFIVVLLATTASGFAGGVRGTIKGDDGTPLAYATIYVRQTESGAVSDPDGKYDVTLPPGQYDLVFHFLGFETQSHSVVVAETFVVSTSHSKHR